MVLNFGPEPITTLPIKQKQFEQKGYGCLELKPSFFFIRLDMFSFIEIL